MHLSDIDTHFSENCNKLNIAATMWHEKWDTSNTLGMLDVFRKSSVFESLVFENNSNIRQPTMCNWIFVRLVTNRCP